MGPFQIRTAALLIAGITLAATPSFAQQGRRDGTRREAGARVPPRAGGESRGSVESQPRSAPRDSGQSTQRIEPRQRNDSPQPVQPRQQTEPRQRAESQRAEPRRDVSPRVEPRGGDYRGRDIRPNDNRRYDSRRDDNRRYDNRSYDYRRYDNRRYDSRVYRPRTYVVPYGYRPYGYRPGWSLNLYFGRPYGVYGDYGYYDLRPGFAYGSLRIVDAPRDAQVFVDGYYAGVVDDYDGVFQHLNLEAGPHTIEVGLDGYPWLSFDVDIIPGRTMTYRANLY
jgi:hypothetical protein